MQESRSKVFVEFDTFSNEINFDLMKKINHSTFPKAYLSIQTILFVQQMK
jgi:hypothetical protein